MPAHSDAPGARAAGRETAPTPVASIVFATLNRRDELRLAINAALAQSVPVEVIVMDDGSEDGTGAMLQSEFPRVRYVRDRIHAGPCFQRNRGIELARARIVLPLDDDAVLVDPDTVRQTIDDFCDPRVGAVAIPFIDIKRSPEVRHRPPPAACMDQAAIYCTFAFVGAAHAVNRDAFLSVGGYREQMFMNGEEGDLCVRLLDAGYATRFGSARPVHHLESPSRNTARVDFHGRKNDVMGAWNNTPWLMLAPMLAATTLNGLWFGLRARRFAVCARGVLAGWRLLLQGQGDRRAVSLRTWLRFRTMKKHPQRPFRLDEVVAPGSAP